MASLRNGALAGEATKRSVLMSSRIISNLQSTIDDLGANSYSTISL
jgi:hypothetical protein